MTKYNLTQGEVAIMRRQYELKVPVKVIAAQWGIEAQSDRYVVYRLFRKFDPDFKRHRQREHKKWCIYCGDDMPNVPPWSRRKYCDRQECKEERFGGKNGYICVGCGKKRKCWHRDGSCSKCRRKRFRRQKGENARRIRYMALEGYSTGQISKAVGLAPNTVARYRKKLGMTQSRRSNQWRPEQEQYWLSMVTKSGSLDPVWEKSGLSRSAFEHRIRRIKIKISKQSDMMEEAA